MPGHARLRHSFPAARCAEDSGRRFGGHCLERRGYQARRRVRDRAERQLVVTSDSAAGIRGLHKMPYRELSRHLHDDDRQTISYMQYMYNRGVEDLDLDWDESNIEHIGRHGIAPREVLEVLRNETLDLDY